MPRLLEPFIHSEICQNLSFTKLFESSSLETKALKESDWNRAVDLKPLPLKDYYEIIDAK